MDDILMVARTFRAADEVSFSGETRMATATKDGRAAPRGRDSKSHGQAMSVRDRGLVEKKLRESHVLFAATWKRLPFDVLYDAGCVATSEPGTSADDAFRFQDFDEMDKATREIATVVVRNGLTLSLDVPRRYATQITSILCRKIDAPLMAFYDVVLNRLIVCHPDAEEIRQRLEDEEDEASKRTAK